MKPSAAVIGAGLSGLSLAHHLQTDADITLFEKSRGPGGRMSTRYSDTFQFDHGAQFFTARSKPFKKFLKSFIAAEIVKPWTPKVVTLEKGKKTYKRLWYESHYASSPKMNTLCKALAEKQNLKLNIAITSLNHREDQWYLTDNNQTEHGPFDWVISSAPAPQTVALFPETFDQFDKLSQTVMTGCYCLMLGIQQPLPFTWGAATVKRSPISWIAIDSTKPDRRQYTSIVIHSTNEWAEMFIEEDQTRVTEILKEELKALINMDLDKVLYEQLHRWRYANTQLDEDSKENQPPYLIDRSAKLAACGDWCIQGKVESAFLSGYHLAKEIAGSV